MTSTPTPTSRKFERRGRRRWVAPLGALALVSVVLVAGITAAPSPERSPSIAGSDDPSTAPPCGQTSIYEPSGFEGYAFERPEGAYAARKAHARADRGSPDAGRHPKDRERSGSAVAEARALAYERAELDPDRSTTDRRYWTWESDGVTRAQFEVVRGGSGLWEVEVESYELPASHCRD